MNVLQSVCGLAARLPGVAVLTCLGTVAQAQLIDVTVPGDPIVGVAATPGSSTSALAVPGTAPGVNNYPPAEPPPSAIDNLTGPANAGNKYLNFQRINAGFIVTPAADSVVVGLHFFTGNDFPDRDPLTVVLEGSADANATTTLNSTWVQIYSGVSGLATDPGRNTSGPSALFTNAASFRSYRLLVSSVRDLPTTANSFQFQEVELLVSVVGTPFCFGDGSNGACPCANSGSAGHGCANSFNMAGALLTVSGSTNPDTVVLQASLMPSIASVASIFFQGDMDAGSGNVFGDGLRCAGGFLIVLGSKPSPGGISQYPEAGDPSISVRGLVTPGSGVTRHYQAYYRNASAAFCPPATFNVTNGVTIVW